MYRYLKSKAGNTIPQPKKNRSSLRDIKNGTRRPYNASFKHRGSLINAFTRGNQQTQSKHGAKIKTGCRADAIAAATQDVDVQQLHAKQKEVVMLLFIKYYCVLQAQLFLLCAVGSNSRRKKCVFHWQRRSLCPACFACVPI